MRFRRKKDDEEVVSGDVVPETSGDPAAWSLPPDAAAIGDDAIGDTVDMEAVAPATAAGGAARGEDDHGEKTNDESTTILQQAVGEGEGAYVASDEPAAPGATVGEQDVATAAPIDAPTWGEPEARVEPEPVASEAAAPAAPAPSVSGSSFTSPGLGADAEPRAAAAANDRSWGASSSGTGSGSGAPDPAATAGGGGGGAAAGGPLASILEHPTVQQRPELAVAGAFAGAFVVAKILKAITSPE